MRVDGIPDRFYERNQKDCHKNNTRVLVGLERRMILHNLYTILVTNS